MPNLMQLGIFLIILGFIIIFISTITANKSNVKGGGIVFIGPIPVFGVVSDKKILYILFGIGIALFILYVIFKKII